jgi:hypothetical protein
VTAETRVNGSVLRLSRRGFLGLILGPLALPATEEGGAAQCTRQRTYSAQATILVFGVAAFAFRNVGGGRARIAESSGQGRKTVALGFTGGSNPDKAHGLNRLGMIEEIAVEQDGSQVESSSLGFMTSNGEETFEQARASLTSGGGNSLPYVAVQGSRRGDAQTWTYTRMSLPARLTWKDLPEVASMVRSAVGRRRDAGARTGGAAGGAFLYSVRLALRCPESRFETIFVHNGKTYRLETSKQMDAAAGQKLMERGMTAHPEGISRLTGAIHDPATGEKTIFHLWMEAGADPVLPLRIEFRPKSFLRLTFDYDPAVPQPPAAFILAKEEI